MRLFLVVIVMLLGTFAPAMAVEPEEMLADPALEARAREISSELRCVVCQNQSIDESDAQIAGDMRRLVREQLLAGQSNAQVKQTLVDYYGEYVLLKPEFSVKNALVWGLPALFALLGLIWYLRRTGRAGGGDAVEAEAPVQAPLTELEKQRLDALMREK
ncbi:MAG: cytochrome c-type biogenesis protein CcmH [Neomegalonema sp.]|nr:cytochrome c-type biogenesis protein CcmH [Neomegalonema sp.]